MSWTSVSRVLGRYSPSMLAATGCAVPCRARALFPPQRTLRCATTVSKPRAKKTPFTAVDDALAVAAAKKNLSTKAPPPSGAVPSPAKSPRKKKTAEPAATPAASSPPGALNGSARNTSTKNTPFAPKKVETKKPAVEAKPIAPAAAKTTPIKPVKPAQVASPAMWSTAAKPAPPKTAQPPPSPPPPPPKVAQPPPPASPKPSAPPLSPAAQMVRDARLLKPKPVDVKSAPEYTRATKKWIYAVTALPILLVTSYFLFDRLVLGNEAKDLSAVRTALIGSASGKEDTEKTA